MAKEFTVLGIAGSLRKGSYNRAALRAAQQLVPPETRIDVFDLDGIPCFNQDEEKNPPAKVAELKARIRAADAVLLVTPEYNYSVPGVLKNAIDWASRPYGDSAWAGKPVAIMGASVGMLGSARAQYHLRQMFVFLNMPAVLQPEVMIASASQKFDAQGNLTDDQAKQLIRQLLVNLVELAHLYAKPDESSAPGQRRGSAARPETRPS
ncbi:MAG: NADPH-dependent FMN reductase [Sulfurifustaceae bacterium]